MASPAAVLNILITANSTQANAQLAKTQATLQRTTATANTASTAVGTRLAGAAKMGAAAVGVGLVYGLGKAVAAGANFEKQMDSVGAVADANTKQMKRLEKQALSLGQKTQYSAQEVAQAQEALVKGGLKLKDVLGGALPASLSLAAAGQMELADASATTVNAMKLFGLEGNKAMQVADMLATAANKTTADVSDFAMALQQGGSAAKAAGYDLNDTITILEALAEVGIKNSDAGTSMKTAFLQLLAPTSKQAELAKKLNLEFVDQNGNLKDAAALSKELHGALDGMTKSQQAANLKLLAGTDGFRTLNALLAQTPDKFKELNDANAENGTANDIAAKKMDNLAGSAEQLSGAVQTLAIKVSKWINPKLRDAIDWMTQALNDLDKVGPGAAFGKTTLKATDVLFRDLNNITDDGLYDIVAKWSAQGKTITKDQVTHWLRLNKISAEQADRLFRTIDRFNQNSEDSFRLLAGYMRGTVTPGIKVFSTKTAGFLDEWSHKGQDDIDDLQKALKKLDDAYEKTGDKTKTATDKMAEAGERMAKSLKSSTNNVTGSFNSMVNATANGLSVMGKNVKNALDAVGVKKAVSFSIEKVGNAAKGFQTGGVIVPGQGDGDKVPALLEPGEVVLNKKAVAAMGGASRANSINQKIPRFATGGVVGGATSGLHPSILKFVSQLYQKYGGSISSGVRAGDSGSLHSTGQAADYVPSNWAGAAAAANRAGSSLLEGIYNPSVHGGPPVSWDSGSKVSSGYWGSATWGDHMDHIHLAVADGTKAAIGAAAENIKRILLKGPDGPLKNMGQGALDKVRDAANRFISSKMPPITAGRSHGPVKGLPDALQKYNRVFPQSSGFGDGYAMPFNAVAALAEWAGAPGVSMARTAIGESQLEPGAVGFDPGGTRGLGLWMITTGFNDALINKLGGESQMRNPILNAQAMNTIFDSQGIGAWYSQTADSSNSHYNGPLLRQMGGIIPKFAKGTKGAKGVKGPSGGRGQLNIPAHDHGLAHVNTTNMQPLVRAKQMWDKLNALAGPDAQGGKIAYVDELIQVAEDLANQDDFLSTIELTKQLDLNKELLDDLKLAAKWAHKGVSFTTTAMGKNPKLRKRLSGLRKNFKEVELATTGITGTGGRLLEQQIKYDALKGTNTGTVASMDISQLRSVIEASRYGVFDGAFAKGGSISSGHWGIAGEAGPEVVRGPATVHPMGGGVNVTNNFDWEGMDLYVETTVNGVIAKRERVGHTRARQYTG